MAVESASTSEDVRVPETEAVPSTIVPSSRFPASMTVPVASPASEVMTGLSLVPVKVTVMVWVSVAPNSSVTVAVKVSVTVWFSLRP